MPASIHFRVPDRPKYPMLQFPVVPSVSKDTFGPLVAYLVPGATALMGVSPFSETLQGWLALSPADAPTVGGFLYLTVAALAAGMTINAVRWAVIDTLHEWTCVAPPPLDFSKLRGNVEGFELLIEIHYRHFQFFGNMLIATAVAYVGYRLQLGRVLPLGWIDLGFLLIEVVFFAASRDTLEKYYARSGQFLGTQGRRGKKPATRASPALPPGASRSR